MNSGIWIEVLAMGAAFGALGQVIRIMIGFRKRLAEAGGDWTAAKRCRVFISGNRAMAPSRRRKS